MKRIEAILLTLAFAAVGMGQSNTAIMDGLVSDATGALIPSADVTVTNVLTGQTFHAAADGRGHWAVPSLGTGTYQVRAMAAGFKTAAADNVHMDAGIPATVNLKMEVGALTETVEVVGGAEVLQATSATVSSDLTGRQVQDLPIPSRNATDLIVTLPGTQTPAGPRNTTIDGLPQSTLNMTLDGINIQDNLLKSTSGGAFYPVVYPRTDAIEEVSVTTAAAGADALAEGAAQIKFITKSGTNTFHGGAFIQERNTALNANYYFNNIDGLPRDRILLHQIGANLGGPIVRNRLFFFFNYEVFRFPQSWNAGSFQPSGFLQVLTDSARNGLFTYQDSKGQVQSVDLYKLAAANGFPSTPDPVIANTLNQIAQLSSKTGSLTSRIASFRDYNRNNYNFLTPGSHKIDFPTSKLDANITDRHHVEAVFNINPYRLFPDGINGVIPILPGAGTVLGSSVSAGQREEFWAGSAAWRSAWSPRWTSEIRFGIASGNVLFFDAITPSLFAPWGGYAPIFGLSTTIANSYVTVPYTRSNNSRRNDPVRQLSGNVSWIRSGHILNFGSSFTEVNEWIQSVSSQQIPSINFGVQASDPVNGIFSPVNLPNSSPTDQSNALALYALLTGRVSSIQRSVALDEKTKMYGSFPAVDRLRQREYGVYAQDSWKIHPKLTLNFGLRFENQLPLHVLSGTYTRPGYAGLFGISGAGNLFQPGATGGSVPVYSPVSADATGYRPTRFWAPTAGVAWVLPNMGGPLGWLTGHGGQSVFRAGFSHSATRGPLTDISNSWGNNQGKQLVTSLDPNNFPAAFGAPGSVLFRDASLPVRTVPTTFPLPVLPGNSLYDFDPNIKNRFVQSWNIGFQRALTTDSVLEIRYVGNRSGNLWSQLNLNEVNIVENGFLDEFKIAQNNLAIARGANPNSSNFFNAGLPGQKDIPIIATALRTPNAAFANLVAQGQAGLLANSIAANVTQMGRLIANGKPANFFVVNPANAAAGAFLTTNQGGTTYNAMQAEVRRRLSAGLQLGVSYAWSHSLSTGNVLSLRDRTGITQPSAFDQRHAFKFNWVYELPFGPGKRMLGNVENRFARKAIGGWQVAGVSRLQSGAPSLLLSGRFPFNGIDGGVVLHNLTAAQLQSMVQIRKTTSSDGRGVVFYLPQSLIDNTNAAFEINGKSLKDLDPTKPYIGPPTTPGQFGNQVFLYGPWLNKWDLSLVKATRIGERQTIEFRAQALNVANSANFFLAPNNDGRNLGINSIFGTTRNSYRDINSTNDPGSRVIEFVLRYRF